MWRNPQFVALNQRVLGSSPSASTTFIIDITHKFMSLADLHQPKFHFRPVFRQVGISALFYTPFRPPVARLMRRGVPSGVGGSIVNSLTCTLNMLPDIGEQPWHVCRPPRCHKPACYLLGGVWGLHEATRVASHAVRDLKPLNHAVAAQVWPLRRKRPGPMRTAHRLTRAADAGRSGAVAAAGERQRAHTPLRLRPCRHPTTPSGFSPHRRHRAVLTG